MHSDRHVLCMCVIDRRSLERFGHPDPGVDTSLDLGGSVVVIDRSGSAFEFQVVFASLFSPKMADAARLYVSVLVTYIVAQFISPCTTESDGIVIAEFR